VKILSHRGEWKIPEERNSTKAFIRSFNNGFGTETDVRDFNGKLSISHDIPTSQVLEFDKFLKLLGNNQLPLAINIKADGLAKSLLTSFKKYQSEHWFVFDMSVPDTISYIDYGINFYSRVSEEEKEPVFFSDCSGIWIDTFESIWYDNQLIESFLSHGKKVCLVSPELHHRSPEDLWSILDKTLIQHENLQLCTDYPIRALKYFNEARK